MINNSRHMTEKTTNDDGEESPMIDYELREVLDSLDGYRDYQKEIRGDSLTFGDF